MAAKTYNQVTKTNQILPGNAIGFSVLAVVGNTIINTQNQIKLYLNFNRSLPETLVNAFSLFIKPQSLQKMKAKFLSALFVTCFCAFVFSTNVHAQVTTVNGPSDNTTAPPASASTVAQVVGAGSVISLKIGSTSTATDIHYQWYKLNSSGTKQLVQDGTDATFHETATGAGYYTYQLLMSNSNQCTSEISDPFKVYVLPALSPTIAASSGTICSNGSSTSTLTANPGNTNYSYLYQWSMNGTDIPGATSATYTTAANTSGNNTYAVKVSYALNSNYSGTASQVINMIAVPTKPAISVGQ